MTIINAQFNTRKL